MAKRDAGPVGLDLFTYQAEAAQLELVRSAVAWRTAIATAPGSERCALDAVLIDAVDAYETERKKSDRRRRSAAATDQP